MYTFYGLILFIMGIIGVVGFFVNFLADGDKEVSIGWGLVASICFGVLYLGKMLEHCLI